tara:strand:- start:352 stop:744 length:393 start_codon:yes stop_codon:yes gene_type:complete
MKYLKHYWKKVSDGSWVTTDGNVVEKRHPESEFPGLGVKVWIHDSNGIDVCLSTVPDSTGITEVTIGSKKAVQEITEAQFNSVKTPLDDISVLQHAKMEAEMTGDSDTATSKQTEIDTKRSEAQTALNAI